ncbi:MAG: hypothetical protein CL933_04095 [Deltaproteobacteria bacterium]|nr:hypothetical protein [Deltaproteobacteria bacterium]
MAVVDASPVGFLVRVGLNGSEFLRMHLSCFLVSLLLCLYPLGGRRRRGKGASTFSVEPLVMTALLAFLSTLGR